MKDYKGNTIKITVVTVLLFTLFIGMTGCSWLKEEAPKPQAQPEETIKPPQPTVEPSPSQPQRDEVQTYEASLAAVGDVLIHSSVYKDAKTEDGYDFKGMFERVKPYIESADLAMANQESMLGGVELGLSDYPRFNGPAEVGDALKDAGFDIINLANNHTLDRGEEAVTNTIRHLDKLGLIYTGSYLSAEDQKRLRTVEKNGITFAFVSYTFGTNGIPVPAGKPYLVNLIEEEKIKSEISEARAQADVVVMNVHFGQEYVNMPNREQKDVAKMAAEAGADIIIGHHPHVLQPMEWIETSRGNKTLIIYSLGNFLAAQEGNRNRTGGILQMQVVKTVKQGSVTIQVQKPAFIPTWINMTNWRKYKIVPLWEAPANQVSNAGTYLPEIAKHMKQWMPELQVVTK